MSQLFISTKDHGKIHDIKQYKVLKIQISQAQKNEDNSSIYINSERIETINHFEYLHTQIDNRGISRKDIRRRFSVDYGKLIKLQIVQKGQNNGTKLRIITECDFPTAINRCETWTIEKIDEDRIHSFEMKCY